MSSLQELNDQDILNLAIKGNENAFAVLFQRYYNVVYRIAFRMLSNKQDAEEASQEAFVKVARSLPQFQQNSSLKTWISRIAINCCQDRRRSRLRQNNLNESIHQNSQEQAHHPQDHQNENNARSQLVQKVLNQLSDKMRMAVILVIFEEMSHAEAAKTMGCSEVTISWQIHAAKKKLKSLIAKSENGAA